MLSYQHDNLYINFDSYWDGTWRHSTSSMYNWRMAKLSGKFRFDVANGTAGAAASFFTVCQLNNSGMFINATTSPSGYNYDLEAFGNMYCGGSYYGTGTGNSIAIGNPICYINTSGVFTSTAFGSTYANYQFVGGRGRFTQVDVFSDARVKKNIRKRDCAKDLELLMKVPMVEYDYIDRRKHPDEGHIGVVAQTLEDIPELKHLVKHHKGYLPDYFKTVDIVEIDDETFTIVGGVQYTDDTKVQFIYEKDGMEENAHGVVKDGKITHKHEKLGCSQVFLYGKEVDDEKAVNYNHLYSLNVSATQELAKRVERLEGICETLSGELKKCLVLLR